MFPPFASLIVIGNTALLISFMQANEPAVHTVSLFIYMHYTYHNDEA